MLAITKQSDYGLILIAFIYKKNRIVKLSELIEATELPKRFLARIAAELTKRKLLISKEGKTGGYLASPNIKTISLHEYLTIFEKEVMVTKCSDKDFMCQYEKICHHKNFIKQRLNKVLGDELKKINLVELIN